MKTLEVKVIKNGTECITNYQAERLITHFHAQSFACRSVHIAFELTKIPLKLWQIRTLSLYIAAQSKSIMIKESVVIAEVLNVDQHC